MKKTPVILISLLLLLSFSASTVAAEVPVPGEQNISVFAKSNYSHAEGDIYADIDDDGKYEAVVDDDTTVTVIPDTPDNNLTLVVRVIPTHETEAHEWFLGCVAEHGDRILPFDIFFVDKYGNRVELYESGINNLKVTVTLPNDFEDCIVCNVDVDGTNTVLPGVFNNGKIAFDISSEYRSSYYVLVAKDVGGDISDDPVDSSDPSDPVDPSAPDSPQTGDNGYVWLWIVLLLISAALLTTLGKKLKTSRK